MNRWLEDKLKQFKEENLNLETYMESLEMIYIAYCNCDVKLLGKLLDNESYKLLEGKVKYL